MPKKKICIDATGIVTIPTGLGKYSLYLLKAMLKRSQFDFTVLCQSSLPVSHELFTFRSDRVRFVPIHVPVIGPQRDVALFRLRGVINQHDVFHCLSSYFPAFGITIPSIVTIHDLKYLLFPEFFNNRLKVLYYSWIINRGVRYTTSIIAVSASTKDDLVALGVPAEKITVIHEAVTIPTELANLDLKVPDTVGDTPFLFFVGDNRQHKNIEGIIEAYGLLMNELGESCPNLVLAGPNFDKLHHKYANTNMSKKLIFLGVISEETLVSLYKRAIALVYPSLYEGFGLPVLEAMSIGTPVITSDCSSLSEVAGNAAVFVDPRDVKQLAQGMRKLVLHESEREAFRKLGIHRAKGFNWEKAALTTLRVYEDIIFPIRHL